MQEIAWPMTTAARRSGGNLIYALLLLFIFQAFYYLKDTYILYVLAKAVFPGLVMLFCFVLALHFLLNHKPYPSTFTILIIFSYLIAISAISSHIYFRQPLLYGITAQIKLLPMFFYFYVYYLLLNNRLDLDRLTSTLLFLGISSLIIYLVIQVAIDPSRVWTKESTFVVHDSKGYRFRFDDTFLIIALFYYYRRFLLSKRFQYLLACLPFFLFLLFLLKERADLVAVLFVLFLITFQKSRFTGKIVSTLICVSGFAALFLFMDYFQTLASGSDSSFLVRLYTLAITLKFISHGVVSLLFGAGNLNQFSTVTFETLYGENFWLSDIGWVGLTYEFGLIGALLLAYLWYLIFRNSRGFDERSQLILFALRDFMLTLLCLSIISPRIAYFSGICMSVLAIFTYYRNHSPATAGLRPEAIARGTPSWRESSSLEKKLGVP